MARRAGGGPRVGADVSSVRLISSGGASVTPAFVEDTARTFDCRVKRTYGSTEAPTVTTSTERRPLREGPRHRRARRRARSSSGSRTPRPARRIANRVGRRALGARARDVRRLRRRGADSRGHRAAAGGSAPATWPRSTARGGCASSAGSRTSSSAAARTSRPPRWRRRSRRTPTSGTRSPSAIPTRSWASASPPSSSPPRRSTSRSAGAGSPAAAWRSSRRPRRSSASSTCPLLGSGKADRAALRAPGRRAVMRHGAA